MASPLFSVVEVNTLHEEMSNPNIVYEDIFLEEMSKQKAVTALFIQSLARTWEEDGTRSAVAAEPEHPNWGVEEE